MTSRVFIKGTNRFSNGRRALSRALEVRQIRRTNSSYRPQFGDVLINWGQSGQSYGDIPTWINNPEAVALAVNKTACFATWASKGIPTVEYTRDRGEAIRWAQQGCRIMHRALNFGSQGRGITMVEEGTDLQSGGFFCQVFGDDANKEYRIHVMDGIVIDTTQKRRRSRENGYEGRFDPTIRTGSNGWVFCRQNVDCPDAANEAACRAVCALGLDFGAVDVGVDCGGRVCIYEVNTAPGVEGTTLDQYRDGLRRAIARRSGAGAARLVEDARVTNGPGSGTSGTDKLTVAGGA